MNIFLETNRLILKPIALSHLEDLFALRSDPDVMQYIGNGSIQTREEVENFIKCGTGYYEKYGLDFFSVFKKETGEFVGQAGLFHVGFNTKQSDIELAYRLHKKYWNRGYATELAKALIKYGFNKLSLPKIIAAVRPENERSRRVMEKVINFAVTGKCLLCPIMKVRIDSGVRLLKLMLTRNLKSIRGRWVSRLEMYLSLIAAA